MLAIETDARMQTRLLGLFARTINRLRRKWRAGQRSWAGGNLTHLSAIQPVKPARHAITIITGHANTTLPMADLKQYAVFNADFLSWVRAQQKAGKSPEQAAAEYKVPDTYPGYGSNLPPFFGGMAGYIKGMYTELGAK